MEYPYDKYRPFFISFDYFYAIKNIGSQILRQNYENFIKQLIEH